MTNRYIQNSMNELKELEMEKERIEEKIKNKQRMFKDYMTTNNLEELNGLNGEKIIFKEILGRRFDTTAFKKAHSYLFELYSVGTCNKRFKFTY